MNTKMIIKVEIEGFPMDNYIIASLLLYIYIIKMFLMILRIVANARGKWRSEEMMPSLNSCLLLDHYLCGYRLK
jgi:hypothetical protein